MNLKSIIKLSILLFAGIAILLGLSPFLILNFTGKNTSDTAKKENYFITPPKRIEIYRCDHGRTETIDFEEYIKGVVACEMPSSFHEEALKAQAVAARTYSTSKALSYISGNVSANHPSAPLCDSTHCQVYMNHYQLKKKNGKHWMENGYVKICDAVESTSSQMLYYNGELAAQALFHSSSGGITEDCENVFSTSVPYLKSVSSPYEKDATHRYETTTFSITEFEKLIKKAFPSTDFGNISSDIKILDKSESGRVLEIKVGNTVLSGKDVRSALNLYSSCFEIDISENNIIITSKGYGHGVGMSQYGADGMAKEGYNYKKILSHYYSGTEVH